MKLISTDIPDLYIVEPNVFKDERGYFFESYNSEKLSAHGIKTTFVQDNQSASTYGVIRGLHYQLAPYDQTKFIRALSGKILDVVVDIRQNSPTFGKWLSFELSEENQRQLYIPKGFAHGFSVLSDYAVVFYKCDSLYHKESERGINFNDTFLAIDWKLSVSDSLVSAKDKVLPFFDKAEMNFFY